MVRIPYITLYIIPYIALDQESHTKPTTWRTPLPSSASTTISLQVGGNSFCSTYRCDWPAAGYTVSDSPRK
ncbi:hypothetical protein Y032_0126g1361 [Ancylostoma ceylanicum]|uniref:Uncharacterized protein n=1 Tax=Ancylostoma ceylanicum TaxID=53326 RepID=A0A016T8W3_9BILA|nr:hypothetical protein Y032_0126g1361 [Ancylostoma ceylanicum]